MDEERRFVYLGENYWTTYMEETANKACEIIDNIGNIDFSNPNNLLELFSIMQYTENIRARINPDVNDERINKILASESNIKKIIQQSNIFFDSALCKNMYDNISPLYNNSLIEYLEYNKKKVKNKLSVVSNNIISSKFFHSIIKSNYLVTILNEDLRNFMIKTPKTAEAIVDSKIRYNANIHLPQSLTVGDIDKILNNYLNSDSYRLDYVESIGKAKFLTTVAGIKIKQLANKIYEEKKKEFFDGNPDIQKIGKGAIFAYDEDLDKARAEYTVDTEVYSLTWLESELDYPTILNNFLYIFDFATNSFDLNVRQKSKYIFDFNDFFGQDNPKYFLYSLKELKFNLNHKIRNSIVMHYADNILNKKGINIFDVINWYFNFYLKDNYNIEKFNININLISGLGFKERNRILIQEIENILKYYHVYKHNQFIIDHSIIKELPSIKIKDVESICDDRYIVLKNEKTQYFKLFRTTGLYENTAIIKDRSGGYDKCIYEILSEYNPEYSMLDLGEKNTVDNLISNNILTVKNGKVYFENLEKAIIMNLIYCTEAIPKLMLNDINKISPKVVDELVADGELRYSNKLLNPSEIEFLSYYLDNSMFDDAIALRNKYSHGCNPTDQEAKEDYYTIIYLLIMIIIKIEGDLQAYYHSKIEDQS